MELDLSEKNILVTGASRGIGLGICKALGRAGACIAAHYNRQADEARKLINEIGNESFIVQADLEHQDQTLRLFDEVKEMMGRIHVLVNNAGVAIHSPVEGDHEQWYKDFDTTLDVNLKAAALLSKMAINHFIDHQGGIIIFISSRAAFRGETKDYLAYAASKGGMVSLAKSIAKSFGKDGVTAFNVAPGFVRTDMAQDFFDRYGEESVLENIALSKVTEAEDLGPLTVLLASGLMEHATGTTIDVNAGSYMH